MCFRAAALRKIGIQRCSPSHFERALIPAINHYAHQVSGKITHKGGTLGAMPIASQYKFEILEESGRSGVPHRTRFHPASMLGPVRGTVLSWCRTLGLLLVLREMGSCCHRIARGWKTRFAPRLDFGEVYRSAPACASHNGMHSCILGIQTLTASRPYLTIGDLELFLQGWFGAEKWANRNVGI